MQAKICFAGWGERRMNWMNGYFWLAYNGESLKQGNLGIVDVMICM